MPAAFIDSAMGIESRSKKQRHFHVQVRLICAVLFHAASVVLGATQAFAADDIATASALQPDGRIILAGYCGSGSNTSFCAVRYGANDAIDSDFGNKGRVDTQIVSGANNNATAVIVQPDGKIVLSGYCGSSGAMSFCAIRYLPNGSLDVEFGNEGKSITPFVGTGSSYAFSAALQPDGKIILGGECVVSSDNSDFCALRYNANGTVDQSFHGNGHVVTPITPGGNDRAKVVLLQPDGRIVLTGFCWNGSDYDFCALRYDSNGALDLNFGSNGTVVTAITAGWYDIATTAALQPDGKIVLAGYCFNVVSYDFCAARYDSSGALDTAFGNGGRVLTPVTANNGYDFATAIATQPDGKIVLAGYCIPDAGNRFCAVRYSPDGQLDATYGSSAPGISSWGPLTASGDNNLSTMLILKYAAIFMAGSCFDGTNLVFCRTITPNGDFSAPYSKNCSLDLDNDGQTLTTTDALIGVRIALGFTGNAVINGITFSPTATRKTWPTIRDFLVSHCNLSLPP